MVYKTSRFHDGRSGSALTIQVIPQSNINKLIDISDDGTLILNLISDPKGVDINAMLISFLENLLRVDKDQIEIIAGVDTNEKLVAILDVSPDELQNRIVEYRKLGK